MRLKPLVIMMALLPVMAVPTSTAVLASDLSLYRGNTTGKTSILLMLDTSGSMGISSLVLPKNNAYGSPGDVDNTVCESTVVSEAGGNMAGNIYEYQYNAKDLRDTVKVNGTTVTNPTQRKTSFYKEVIINGTTVPYYVRGCGTATVDSNGKLVESGNNRFDRLSRLKDAVLTLLADTALSNNIQIGLGHFSSKTDLFVGKTDSTRKIPLVDGHSGTILLPANALTPTHRLALAQKIAAFKSLDTTTNEQGVEVSNQKYSSLLPPLLDYKASSGTPTAHAYAEAAAYMMGTQTRKQTYTGDVKFIYDGTSFVVNENAQSGQPKQAYYICAEVATSGSTNGLGYTGNVKWCQNAWPGINSTSGGKLIPSVQSNIKIPYGDSEWLNLTGNYSGDKKTAVDVAKTKLNAINFANDWDVYTKLPSGWRYGGWMKVDQQPMDIEPIAGLAWESFKVGNTQYFRNLVSYRASPFTLDGTNDNVAGGFSYSAATTKDPGNSTKYKAGGSTSSCDGNGIYFLTDGAPNSTKDSMARWIMNDTLTTALVTGSPAGTYGFSQKPTGTVLESPSLKSNLFSVETGGWEYIGEYSKKILNPTRNPAGMKIKTAVVGFGSSFAGIPKNGDGSYNCEAVNHTNPAQPNYNPDAYNACKWGGAEYGDGGFYYAENADDIKNSIVKFVSDITVGFTPSSLGSISVPRDPLDQTKSMTEGFFPMMMPMEDSTFRTWAGNLKKYKILGGTLKDSSNNAIYKVENNQQIINSSAKDLWSNAAAGSDHSLINSGGAWNKIPVPSTALAAADSISNVDSERKVYILDGSSLKKVTKTNLATDTTGTDALSGTYTINQRLALLNYMGYQTAFPAAASKTTLTSTEINTLAVNPASPYRFLGGVLHSTPLMLTQEATVSGANAAGTRDEYTVYGSMDGGLHIVDAKTGKEQSVFVPPEIISNQYDTLAGKDSKGVASLSGIAYGVDAPWVADNTFKVQITKSGTATTTKYVANKMNIYGGLRMGGSGLYGLDILSPASPKLLFQIKPTTTNEFQRMAQIWAKPTIAEIRVKGERKKVLIFGGGYDAAAYEQANAANPSSTYGNALYVVDATNGNLIWMSSSNGSGISDSYKKTINGDINYSVVGQPVVRDYDADGLTDMIYFADLGGQIFRVDLNNNDQMSATTNTNIAVRVQTLAKLKDGTFVPRFYERLSTAVFDDGQNRFVLVTAGSGNRSFPLEVEVGGKNKIYGLIDRDAAANGLENLSFTSAATILPANLANSGILGKTVTKQVSAADIANMKLTSGNTMLRGWSFELRSVDSGNYARAFEESQLITGDLYVSLYDPKATLTGTVSGCGGGVTGISTTHRICMPYGDCAAYVKTSYQGINGPAFGAVLSEYPRTTMLVGPVAETQEACVGNCPTANTALTNKNLYTYSQARKIKPVRWFEW